MKTYQNGKSTSVLEQFSKMTKPSKEWKYYELNTGHDVMGTLPR